MNREAAIKALDEAFAEGVKHLFGVFVQGLIGEEQKPAELAEHFGNGLAFHCDAHGKTTAIVENYFKGFKS